MNLLILSDLHIDANDRFGTFQWDEVDFIVQMEEIRDKYKIEKVIFNGDTFELMKYSFHYISTANPILMKYLLNNNFIFIKGNHDIINSFGEDSYDIENSSGQRIHIEHGHNADWINGTRLGRGLGNSLFSLLKRLIHIDFVRKVYFRAVAFDDQINDIPKRYNTLKYLTYAIKLLKENDVVILSHTHKLESHHTYYLNKKKRYLNSGTCSLGRFQAIILDTETLRYEMIKQEEGAKASPAIINYAV
jgi:predicted phosphodiesterase